MEIKERPNPFWNKGTDTLRPRTHPAKLPACERKHLQEMSAPTTSESCCICDSLGPGFISKTGLSLEMSSMWFQLQSHEGYTSNGVMDIPQLLNRVTEPRQCMAGKCPHEGPKRARGPEKPLHEAEKVEPGLYQTSQNVSDTRAMGQLPRRGADTEWNQLRSKGRAI